jgi:hypothetical protein
MPFTPIPLSLACLTHLASLTIQSSISFVDEFWINNPQYSGLPVIMRILDTLTSPPANLVHLVISINVNIEHFTSDDISDINWSPLLSFPYFDVIPRIELRVRAKRWGYQVPSLALLKSLNQNPHLMQLERHHSFLINAMEESDRDQLLNCSSMLLG